METCGACGANLSAGIDWCPRCYAPVRPGAAGRPVAPVAPVAPGGGAAGGTPPVPLVTAGRLGFAPPPPEEPVHVSRWRAGPTSFGPFGRLLLSVGVLVVGVLLYAFVLVNLGVTPTPSSILVFAVVYTPFAVWMWSRIWRPERTR